MVNGTWSNSSGVAMPLDWRERRENNEAVLEQFAIPPPYALLREVRLRKPWPAHPRRAAVYFVTRLPGWRSRPPPWWTMVGSLRESISSYATIYAPDSTVDERVRARQAFVTKLEGLE